MAESPGFYVEITEDMMVEFVRESTTCDYDQVETERKKDVRSAFVTWLHLKHNRYEKDITNSTARQLYDLIFDEHEPNVDEAIDANGDGVFLGLVLFNPGLEVDVRGIEPLEVPPAPTSSEPSSDFSMLLQQPSQWTSENLAEYTNQVFQQIVALGQENRPLADVLLNLLGRSIVESHLNTQGIYLSLHEFREDLRSCLDEIVGNHVEEQVGYQAEELKRRFDRVFERHAKQIEQINEWRNRFDDM